MVGKIIIAGVLVALGWSVWAGQGGQQSTEQQEQVAGVVEEAEVIPYSLEDLRTKLTEDGVITIEREPGSQDGFSQFVVSYRSEELKQYALMNVPTGDVPEGGFPVVIVNHGHIPPEEYSTTGNYTNTSAFYARNGFLVLKPDYRGHDESEGEAGTIFSRISYAVDVANLVLAVNSLADANPGKIFMYGHSMGGDVSLRVMEMVDDVKAATLWAPAVKEFPEGFLYFARRNQTGDRLMRYQRDIEQTWSIDQYSEVDVLAQLDNLTGPVIVQHGTADESVPYSWGEELVTALETAGKQVTFYSYEGDNHDIAGNFGRALTRDVEFFNSLP